ncbi:MAG: hypothetical protein ACP5RN_15105 [Armatimonadota bacterium]
MLGGGDNHARDILGRVYEYFLGQFAPMVRDEEVVFDCATRPRLIPVQDPVRLNWEPIVRIEHYQIRPDQLEGAGRT